ncbi:uncharacterized protein LOC142564173 isoform X2 [Dermacentor variabilis]|uniref:uncharacterized protein LOC142564173 isoform X2 n=1 Tax=Dermacentor variabilis TaxID=34621 RepID=UPI003F5B438C
MARECAPPKRKRTVAADERTLPFAPPKQKRSAVAEETPQFVPPKQKYSADVAAERTLPFAPPKQKFTIAAAKATQETEKRNLPLVALMGSQRNLCRLKPHGCSAAMWMLQLRHQEASTCANQPRRHLLLSRCTCGQKPQISLNPRTVTLICLSFLQRDGTCVDCSTSPATVRMLYDGSCIVRWCTKTSPRRLFRVPKDESSAHV